ncbi:hypothetical protein P879_03275 [Paragonimus westermani]|uniref:Coiled-coil domain-containing protein 153 n=1 Tax=Paragonimus westermani TaxID=34504 RepID=A0A8T0DQM9_9TREM|nr:hypothetical protein P879_03275 [Paragonimus westermani]
MSKRTGSKKGRSTKGKKDPSTFALEQAQKDSRSLRDQLSRTILLAEAADNRRCGAYADRLKSARNLEEVRYNTQQHTAFLVTQHEMIVSNLNDKIEKFEEDLRGLNEIVRQKDEELDKLKRAFSETMTERELTIDRLKKQLGAQGAKYEDILLKAFERVTSKLGDDYMDVHRNVMPWSEKTLANIELEFLNPPYLDEESTEFY